MKLFYWTVFCRDEQDQEYTLKVPTGLWQVLFLWAGNAKVLVRTMDNGINVLSMYYESRLHNKLFNTVAQSASGDPSWDLKELCNQMKQYQLRTINEIRRNRKS